MKLYPTKFHAVDIRKEAMRIKKQANSIEWKGKRLVVDANRLLQVSLDALVDDVRALLSQVEGKQSKEFYRRRALLHRNFLRFGR